MLEDLTSWWATRRSRLCRYDSARAMSSATRLPLQAGGRSARDRLQPQPRVCSALAPTQLWACCQQASAHRLFQAKSLLGWARAFHRSPAAAGQGQPARHVQLSCMSWLVQAAAMPFQKGAATQCSRSRQLVSQNTSQHKVSCALRLLQRCVHRGPVGMSSPPSQNSCRPHRMCRNPHSSSSSSGSSSSGSGSSSSSSCSSRLRQGRWCGGSTAHRDEHRPAPDGAHAHELHPQLPQP